MPPKPGAAKTAPPKTYNYPDTKYTRKNPTNCLRFAKYKLTHTDKNGNTTQTLVTIPERDKGYDILTDEVLSSGNLELLMKFQEDHRQELADPKHRPAREYINARIRAAKKIDKMKKKAREKVAVGKKPPQAKVQSSKDGWIGLPSLQYPGYQTSANGCWSCSLSLLLKSRGVDLPQEDIRAWRPDYPADMPKDRMLTDSQRTKMNSDVGRDITTSSDLVSQVLPNTAVNQMLVSGFPAGYLFSGKDSAVKLTAEQEEKVKEQYLAQAKEQLKKTIHEALTVHRSPVAITWDGHYVTVTGINPQTGMLLVEDSLESRGKLHGQMSLDDVIREGLTQHEYYGNQKEGGGLQLEWLSDLPTPEYNKKKRPTLDEKYKDEVKLDDKGNVIIQTRADGNVSNVGNTKDGQIESAGVGQAFLFDQSKLPQEIRGNVYGFGGMSFELYSTSRIYPKKMVQLGDPELTRSHLKSAQEYAIPQERLESVRGRSRDISDALDATGTGTYLGIISRRSNSPAFTAAREAIRALAEKEAPSPEDVMSAVESVKSYLSGKEKVRVNAFGRERWNLCMSFLSETMPPEEFKEYCDEVNEIRGAEPKDKNYVTPESFRAAEKTVGDAGNKTAVTRDEPEPGL